MGQDILSRLTVAPSTPAASFSTLYPLGATDAAGKWYYKNADGNIYTLATVEGAQVITRQVFITGTAATYTTPAGVRQLRVRLFGGGGAGSGTGTTGPNNGTAGNATSFNSIVAAGGSAGVNISGGAGGTGGTGTASMRMSGIAGGNGAQLLANGTNTYLVGGNGAGQGGGVGGGASDSGSAGGAGIVNTGAGGGGGGAQQQSFSTISAYYQGAGGGQGEYVEYNINSPAGSYTYTVGAVANGGGAGTSGAAGGNGGSGLIVVDEYY